jgi:cellulose 1,4-beta-cellobiosidase
VAGSSGQTSGGSLNHPAMFISLNVLGSLILDFETNRLDVSFLNSGGTVQDTFTIVKDSASPPYAPTGLSATAGNGQVSLNWNNTATATSYHVKRATVAGGPYATIAAGVTSSAYTDTTVVNGTTYYYVVSANNANGEGANSTEASATPQQPQPPAPPTALTATPGKKKVTLRWTQSASPNITQNKVYRSTTAGGPYSLIATLSATTQYNNTGLQSGTTYYYVVTAVTSSGLESAYSNQASATPR